VRLLRRYAARERALTARALPSERPRQASRNERKVAETEAEAIAALRLAAAPCGKCSRFLKGLGWEEEPVLAEG
jgi:hypothetical protein